MSIIYIDGHLSDSRPQEWCRENYLHERHLSHAAEIRRQLLQLCAQAQLAVGSSGQNTEPVRRSLAAGLFPCAAQLTRDGHHVTVGGSAPTRRGVDGDLVLGALATRLYRRPGEGHSLSYHRALSGAGSDWEREDVVRGFTCFEGFWTRVNVVNSVDALSEFIP